MENEYKTYSRNWIKKNLGITLDTIKQYERKKLITPLKNKENGYMEFTEKDLKKIWTIKLLRDIGYEAEYIKKIMDEEINFYDSLCIKADELENEIERRKKVLEFLQTIKFIGVMPGVKIGEVRFDDFLNSAIQNWNMFNYEKMEPSIVKVYSKKIEDWTEEDLEGLEKQYRLLSEEDKRVDLQLWNYIEIILDLKNLEPNNKLVMHCMERFEKFFDEEYKEIKDYDESFKLVKLLRIMFKKQSSDFGNFCTSCYGEDESEFMLEVLKEYEKYKKGGE